MRILVCTDRKESCIKSFQLVIASEIFILNASFFNGKPVCVEHVYLSTGTV